MSSLQVPSHSFKDKPPDGSSSEYSDCEMETETLQENCIRKRKASPCKDKNSPIIKSKRSRKIKNTRTKIEKARNKVADEYLSNQRALLVKSNSKNSDNIITNHQENLSTKAEKKISSHQLPPFPQSGNQITNPNLETPEELEQVTQLESQPPSSSKSTIIVTRKPNRENTSRVAKIDMNQVENRSINNFNNMFTAVQLKSTEENITLSKVNPFKLANQSKKR